MTWLAYSHLGVPKRVTLTQQPGGARVNQPFTAQPIAKLVDGSGVLARVQDVNVVASKVAGVGTLSGTLTIPTVDGLATFTDLQMDTVTATVTLGFASSGLVSVNATPFNVTTTQFTIGMVGTTYTISGSAVTLTATRKITADAGSYTITGVDANAYSTSILRMVASSYIPAGGTTPTTARLTAPSGKTSGANFQAGLQSDDTNPLPTLDLASGKYTELEWCLQTGDTLAVDNVYQFRVVEADGTALTTYSVTPQWTIAAQSGAFNMVASAGSYALTGTAVTLRSNRMTADAGSYVLTGSPVALTWSGGGSGGPVLFTETFANSSFAARGWYDLSSTDWVASPAPSGMPGALRMTWTAGQTNASTRTMRRLFSATDRVYVKYQQAFSANWVGSGQSYHPHLVMCLSELDGDYGNTADSFLAFYCETNYQSGNRPAVKFQDNQYVAAGSIGSNVGEARATCGANGQQGYADSWDLYADSGISQGWYNSRNLVGAVQMATGNTAWHTIEVEVVLNTVAGGIGQTDGICRYWWDGVLVWERTNLIMRTGTRPTLRFNQFLLTPYIGDGSPVTQSTYIGDLTVATSRTSGGTPPASAAITGTTTGAWYESEVVAGGKTLVLTLTNDTWVAAGAVFDAQRQNILNGITAASSPAAGWNNRRSGLAVTNVVRTSNTVVTITLGALATYSVAANETLTVTIPATALSGGNAITALPTLTITEGSAPTFDAYANRPTNYTTVVTDYAFSAALPTAPSDVSIPDGSGWSLSSAGSLARVSDATAPRSAPYAAQWTYPPGHTAGTSVGKFYRSVGSATAFYISLAVWHDSNFDFNSVSNKFVTFFNSDGGTDLLETSHFGVPWTWQFERPSSTALYGPNTAFGTSITESDLRGTWWNIEIQYVGGVGTGSVRVWAGRSDGSDGAAGQLVMQHTGINVYLPAPEFQLDSTWGGGPPETPSQTSYRRIDHFYMSHP